MVKITIVAMYRQNVVECIFKFSIRSIVPSIIFAEIIIFINRIPLTLKFAPKKSTFLRANAIWRFPPYHLTTSPYQENIKTDLLAAKDAKKLALIGAGAQARSHLAAIKLVRDIEEVHVYDLSESAASRFAKEMEARYGIPVIVENSVAEAVMDADIICTLCPAKEAYLFADMVKEGAHINAVGTFTPTTREVGSDLVAAARLYSDYTPACKKESGEYLLPLAEGLINENHIIGSLGELLLQKIEGRESEKDITIFVALGIATEDVACAKYVVENI